MISSQKNNEALDLPTAKVFFDENGILWVQFKDGIVMEVEDAKVQAEGIIELAKQEPQLILVDARDIFINATAEARSYLAEHQGMKKVRRAQAFVVNSLANKMIAKFYTNTDNPGCPAKIFNDQPEEAIAWLLEQE